MPEQRRKPEPKVITDLLSFRLNQLASISSATATLRYERKFELTLLEWRSIAMLGGYAPMSLKELARRAGLDKSYASRTVSALTKRGYVLSEKDGNDGRGVMLTLSPSGKAMYRKVLPDAIARNERLLSVLSDEQRDQLFEMLNVLQHTARRLLEQERGFVAGDPETIDEPPERPAQKKAADSAVISKNPIDLDEMRYLVARLGELISSAS